MTFRLADQPGYQRWQAKRALIEAAHRDTADAIENLLTCIEHDPLLTEREKENIITKIDAIFCDRFGRAPHWDWSH